MATEEHWTPDRKTVRWWMGIASENRIVESFIGEVRPRVTSVRYDSNAYWQLLADTGVKYYRADLPAMAERWTATATDLKRRLEQDEETLRRDLSVSPAADPDWSGMTWTPDPETVRWWTNLVTGDRIVETLEGEVKERSVGIELHSDAYWHLVVEVAVEHLHFELYDTAKAWGTVMDDPERPEQQEQPPPL